MSKLRSLRFLVLAAFITGVGLETPSAPLTTEKLYVAVEGAGKISVLDPGERRVLTEIDISKHVMDRHVAYSPHNVQVAPDGRTVWVTANVDRHDHDAPLARSIPPANRGGVQGSHEKSLQEPDPDEVIVIDPVTDSILKRIPIGVDQQLAHVVITRDGGFAYVAAQKPGTIFKIDAGSYQVVSEIKAREGSQPHGMRMAPDGSLVYIALLQGKALGLLQTETGVMTEVPLKGLAVQAGVTPNGQYAFASQYDTRQLAIYHVLHKAVVYVSLGADAKGPLQMYPTPDSRYVYLADQGHYFDQPIGEFVYKVDLNTSRVVKTTRVGLAPHGVVVSPDGKRVYVTNLLSGDVSIIDTTSDQEIDRISVGAEPNGISIWFQLSGGTP